MIDVTVEFDTAILDRYRQAIARAPRTVNTFVQRSLKPNIEQRALSRLQQAPPPPDLPFVWSLDPRKNARAQRWYFANKVPPGSKGGRYQRTGALGEAWQVTFSNGELSLTNSAPGAEYVQGDFQVPSHIDSGWENVNDVALDEAIYAQDAITDVWQTIFDAPGGAFA